MANIHQQLHEALTAIGDIADGVSHEIDGKFFLEEKDIATLREDANNLVAAVERYAELLKGK